MLMSRKWDITKDRIDPVPGDPNALVNPSPIAYGDGKLTRKAPAGKRPEIDASTFLTVDASGLGKKRPEEQAALREKLESYTENGFSPDVPKRDAVWYIPLCQSPGGVKGAASIWVDASKRDALLKWWHCGYALSDIDLFTRIEKDARMFTACSPWKQFFGEAGVFTKQLRVPVIPEIDIRKLYVLDEVETANHLPLEGMDQLFWIHDGKWTLNSDPHAEKDSDGVIYYIIRDLSDYTIEERRVFRKLAERGKIPNFTINAPGFKGCVHFLLESTLQLFFKREGLEPTRKDVFGREFNLFDAQVICGKSAFKWVKSPEVVAGGFELFARRFLEYGHTFDVSVVPHPVWRPLPYQMTTGLWPDQQGEQRIIARSVDRLRGYADPELATDLLPKYLKDALGLCPSMWADPYLKFSLQAGYERKRWSALTCMLDRAGKYYFVLPDTILCLQAWFGKPDQAVGAIHGGCVIHQPSLWEVGEGADICILRNPMPGLNQCPRQLQPVPADYAGLYGSDACFISGQDDSMARMQCDFDGDKVFVVVDSCLVGLFRDALKRTGYLTVRWVNSDLPKPEFSWDAFHEFIVKAPLAEVGLVFSNGNRIKAADSQNNLGYDLRRNGLVEVAGTNIIDAAKGTGEKVTALDDLIQDQYKDTKQGTYMFYKKTPSSVSHISALKSSERQRLSEIAAKNEQKYELHSGFWMDRLSEAVRKNTPETLTVEAPEAFGRFNISLLYGEAATKGETRFAELLDDAIEEHSTLYRAVQGSDNMAARKEAQEMFYEDLRAQILARGLACGLSVSQTVTALVKAVYNGAFSQNYNMYIHERHFRIMWMCFGKELLANLAANCKKAGDQPEPTPSASSEDNEEEEDADYMEDCACWSDEDADGEFIM